MFTKTYQLISDSPPPMDWNNYTNIILEKWNSLLSSAESKHEAAFQKFLEEHPCMLPGAFGLIGTSGHAPFPAAVIAQPPLPGFTRRVPDFMWIATDSGTVYPVLIEIEAPDKKWFNSSGVQTAELTQALDQLAEWKIWFSNPLNAELFKQYYKFPDHLLRGRILKPLYVLIYGRRLEANQSEELSSKRPQLSRVDEFIMTFDRLTPQYDCSDFLSIKLDKNGFRAITIPPTLRLGPTFASYHRYIQRKEDATLNSPYLPEARREFLCSRFSYWDMWSETGNFRTSGDWE